MKVDPEVAQRVLEKIMAELGHWDVIDRRTIRSKIWAEMARLDQEGN